MLNRSILLGRLMMLCLLLTFFNCSSDDDGDKKPNTLNPRYELSLALEPDWVRDRIGDGEFSVYTTIDKGVYNNLTVYVFGSCCPTCYIVPTIYDKDGNQLEVIAVADTEIDKVVYRGTACEQEAIIY